MRSESTCSNQILADFPDTTAAETNSATHHFSACADEVFEELERWDVVLRDHEDELRPLFQSRRGKNKGPRP